MGFWDGLGDIAKAAMPLLGPIGGIASTIIDANSQQHTNQANAQQAQKQMDFQAQQSATTYQRGVKDMEAAGLNPGLAYQQGGAPAAGGAQATMMPTTSNTPGKLATALDTYNSLATGVAQRDLIREQTTAAAADAALKDANRNVIRPDATLGQSGDYINSYVTSKIAANRASTQGSENYPTQFKANLNNLNANTATAEATAANLRSQTTLNEQQMQNEWFRKNVSPYLNSTAAAIKPFTPIIKYF